MKNPFILLGIMMLMSVVAAVSAYADNSSVENAIASRPDLSTFYKALVNTGVNHELSAGVSYTIFAPTNDAFARIRPDQYPCFYMVECRAQVAQIVRNHIIAGDVYIDDAVKQKGALYSLSGRFVNVGAPYRNDYAVDGNNVLYMSWFGGGILYKIDGVIANPRELASVQFAEYAYVVPQEQTVVTTRTIADPACGSGGCPDAVSQTTTRTRSAVIAPTVMVAPTLAPAAGW